MAKAATAVVSAQQENESPEATGAQARYRSPNFPFISLERAIERTRTLYGVDRMRVIALRVACQRWEFKVGGSQADQTVAALKAFGLIEVLGKGDARMLHITERAYRIIGGARDAAEQIKEAALAPALHAELWQRFGTSGRLPGDDVIRHYLVFDRENGRFAEASAETFIARFHETIAFAKLDSCDKTLDKQDEVPTDVSVGDFVQWESQGALQLPEPRRVTNIIEDGKWLYIEGSLTAIPRDQIRKVEAPSGQAAMNPAIQQTTAAASSSVVPPFNPNFKTTATGAKQDVFTTDTGEVVVRWPAVLSAEEYSDIEGWLDMLKRKIKRSVKDSTDGNQN